MESLSAGTILHAWESTLGQSASRRALVLLAIAKPGRPAEELASWSVPRRDAELMRLRHTLFGSIIQATAACPNCRESIELSFDLRKLTPPENSSKASGQATVDELEISFRLPNTLDLQAIEGLSDTELARQTLLQRCIENCVDREGWSHAAEELSAAAWQTVARGIAALDDSGGSEVSVRCPSCRFEWPMLFDITAYLCRELTVWARRLFREVHILARSYGWAESEILAMPAQRRRAYLDLLGQS